MNLQEIGINAGNWVQDRDYWRALVNATLNLWVPKETELVTSTSAHWTQISAVFTLFIEAFILVRSVSRLLCVLCGVLPGAESECTHQVSAELAVHEGRRYSYDVDHEEADHGPVEHSLSVHV